VALRSVLHGTDRDGNDLDLLVDALPSTTLFKPLPRRQPKNERERFKGRGGQAREDKPTLKVLSGADQPVVSCSDPHSIAADQHYLQLTALRSAVP
jgi:hypothetical protein